LRVTSVLLIRKHDQEMIPKWGLLRFVVGYHPGRVDVDNVSRTRLVRTSNGGE